MITPQSLSRLLFVIMLGSLSLAPLSARVGEPQDAIERRLLQPGLGRFLFQNKGKETPQMERERQKELSEQPFNDARKFFPADTRPAVYWKSAVAKQLSNENGWKVHVFYAGSRSILEGYHRVGEALSEFEVRALLAANQGASSWRKISSAGSDVNGIGYDFELEDGSLRAKQKGNWLMIFSTRLDEYVIAQQVIAREEQAKNSALKKLEQQKNAPDSVIGL
jgi:hypothetical protein